MKSQFKFTSLLLALIIALGSFSACAESGNSNDNTEDSGTQAESSTVTDNENAADLSLFPENAFPIFDGKTYAVKVVTSDTASSAERQVAANLRSSLKAQTKLTLNASTDFLAAGESYNSSAYEILIGETKHEEATSVFGSSSFNGYGIKAVGNKIIFYFSTADEGKELVSLFMAAIKSTDKGALWVPSSIKVGKSTSIHLIDVPTYPAQSLTTVDCADDTAMIVASNTTLAKFNEYCATLVASGYTEYSKRDNVGETHFRTYTKGTKALTVYFSNGTKQARIIAGPLKDIPSKNIDQSPAIVEPTLSFIAQSNSVGNGLALIYQLSNGKFIIVDGGYYLSDKIYKELKTLQPDASKITIAAWFVSHPHIDHQDTLERFIRQHANEIEIESLFFNYVDADYYDNLTAPDQITDPDAKEGDRVNYFREIISKYFSRSTKIIKPHTGQIYSFGEGAEVEIIWTVEDLLPTALDRINTSSMIIRVTVAGTSTMVLADATGVSKQIMLNMYGSHLESDIVTLAHHGIWIDTPEMYNTVKAPVLLWPANTAGANEGYTHSYSRPAILAALENATDVYLSKGTNNVLKLPYKTVNNKEAFIQENLTSTT
jgi:beta-lactamase superfamily II metal-dependent hydrolase